MTKMAMEALVRELMSDMRKQLVRMKALEEELKKKDELHAEENEELKKENRELKALLTRKEEEMVGRSNEEEGCEPLDWKVALTEVPDGILKWEGEYRGRASGDRYSEEEILHAQREGLVLLTKTVFQGQHGYYREEVWFSKEREEEEYWASEDEGYTCHPGWKSPEEYLEETEESYPDEVKEKAVEIMAKAVWLPNFSHPTWWGKYFLEGKSGESGFISWKEGETLCYVSDEKGNVLQTNGKPEQYKGFKGGDKKRYRHLLGTLLLDYFAPWR